MTILLMAATECPKCGCNDIVVVASGCRSLDGEKLYYENIRCNHCGNRWRTSSDEQPPVYYQIVRCPWCDSTNTGVSRTARPVRYHKCSDCDRTFKSVER